MNSVEFGKNEPVNKKKRTRASTDDMTTAEDFAFRASFFSGFNDYQIYVRTWDKVEKPKGVVLILHGMVEHGLRYDEFAKYLNTLGLIVVVPDERAHGITAGAPENVAKCENDIFADTVRDDIKLADTLKQKYKLPIYLIAHSYGSFRLQALIQKYHGYAGAVIVGSACHKGNIAISAGKMLAWFTKIFKGKRAPAKLVDKIVFGAYRKKFDDGNWLTSDERLYSDYCHDPYCGNIASAQFYCSFFSNIKKLYKPVGLKEIDKNLPLLITSGELDPVGGKNHSLIDKLMPLYKKYGVVDVVYKLWKNGKHEILNETFRQEVYNYIGSWIIKNND